MTAGRAVPHIGDAERRARLVRRHHLGRTAPDVTTLARDVVALHSSDPSTPHLSAWARVGGFRTRDLDDALLDARTLVRIHAMRRTLFVVAAAEAPALEAAVSADIAAKERKRVEGWVEEAVEQPARPWLDELEAQVLDVLAADEEPRTQDLAAAVPGLGTKLTVGSGKWSGRVPLSSRLLYLMAMEGRIVRTRPTGRWRSSQYRWAHRARWLGRGEAAVEPEAGRARLVESYLAAMGPATMTDLRWWTGMTVRRVEKALTAAGAVPVSLDGGGEGFELADDVEARDGPAAGVALLPGLDHTPMGWKEREWYLGPHAPPLFDRSGNVGPTVWVDGRIVGGWAQRPDGEVAVRFLEDVGREAAEQVQAEAAALAAWMDGDVVTPRFRTPLEREIVAA